MRYTFAILSPSLVGKITISVSSKEINVPSMFLEQAPLGFGNILLIPLASSDLKRGADSQKETPQTKNDRLTLICVSVKGTIYDV